MKLSETEWYLNEFLIFCQSKNLSKKTISSYEQTLKLFLLWLKNKQDLEEINRVKTGHIISMNCILNSNSKASTRIYSVRS
ncbi:site-specific integrase [Metabacillus iocasae]|uniref:site-specific integrase n=1 Tax=Priestia iocasae TaxID=2291674 RepID=UPI001EF80EB2|nr:site-specific integrase [Metabacillus iocasae]